MLNSSKDRAVWSVELTREEFNCGRRWKEVFKISNLLEDVFGERYETSWDMAIELMDTGRITCGYYPEELAESKRATAQAALEAWELVGFKAA